MEIETAATSDAPRPREQQGREKRKKPPKAKGDGTYYDEEWGQWRYRTRVTLPRSGRKIRISDTPAVNTRAAARIAMEAHKRRVIEEDLHPELALEKNRERWTLARLAEKVREHVAARQRPATARHYKDAFAAIGRHLGEDIDIATITAGRLLDLDTALRKEFSPGTTQLYMGKLRASMGLAVTWEALGKVPAFPRIKRLKQDVRYLTDAEVERLIAASPNDTFRCMVRLALVTGMRRGELIGLQWRDIQVDANGRFVKLHLTRQVSDYGIGPLKSGEARTIHVTATARAILGELRGDSEQSPVSEWVFAGRDSHVGLEAVKGWMESAMTGAKITFEANGDQQRSTDPKWHSLRHTFAVRAVRGGMHLAALKDVLGHSDIRTTMIYARFAPSDVAAQMEAIFDGASLMAA